MGAGINRTEWLRKDCPTCNGNGYTGPLEGHQEVCNHCGGSGQLEIEVPFKFDGERTQSEIEELWKQNT